MKNSLLQDLSDYVTRLELENEQLRAQLAAAGLNPEGVRDLLAEALALGYEVDLGADYETAAKTAIVPDTLVMVRPGDRIADGDVTLSFRDNDISLEMHRVGSGRINLELMPWHTWTFRRKSA